MWPFSVKNYERLRYNRSLLYYRHGNDASNGLTVGLSRLLKLHDKINRNVLLLPTAVSENRNILKPIKLYWYLVFIFSINMRIKLGR